MIILAGGGDSDQARAVDQFFAGAIDIGGRVVYIPVAMEPHVFSYAECEAWFRRAYAAHGITNIEVLTDLRTGELDGAAAVYIGGGNTFRLLAEVRDSGFGAKLRAYAKSGGVIYGGSAGALLLGASIEHASLLDANAAGLTDFAGLNLLDGWDVWCHYRDEDAPLIQPHPRPLYVLREEGGIAIDGKNIQALGAPYLVNAKGAELA